MWCRGYCSYSWRYSVRYVTYTLYTVTTECPFCGHHKNTELRRYELQNLLEYFKPCKTILCSRCNAWFPAAKHSKLCGVFEKCFECLFAGSTVMKFSRLLKKEKVYEASDFSYTTTYSTTASWGSSSTSYTTYAFDSSDSTTTGTSWTTVRR